MIPKIIYQCTTLAKRMLHLCGECEMKREKLCFVLPGEPDGLLDLSSPFVENISDTPKSTILTVPSAVINKLSGLISKEPQLVRFVHQAIIELSLSLPR